MKGKRVEKGKIQPAEQLLKNQDGPGFVSKSIVL